MLVHIVAIAYDGNVSAIVRQDPEVLRVDLIDNHGDPDVEYPDDLDEVVEEIANDTGYTLTHDMQEIN